MFSTINKVNQLIKSLIKLLNKTFSRINHLVLVKTVNQLISQISKYGAQEFVIFVNLSNLLYL